MTKRNFGRWVVLSVMLGVLTTGIGLAADAPKSGGTLRYATIGTPPTLDEQVVTADITTTIMQHVFEGLFTFTEKCEAVPMLAENYEVKDGGKLVAIGLRQNVPFHNGKEMTSADVVASLTRWGNYGVRGPVLFKHVEKVEADGKYGVKIYFKEPFAPWKNFLAYINGGPSIYTKEVAEVAGAKPIPLDAHIGTGPYKFVEWNSGRYILLARFDDYAARAEAADGYAGKRTAYFDQIKFIPVPDPGTRVNGIKAGDYDFAEQIPGDLFEGLNNDPDVKTVIRKAASFGELFFNEKEGMMTNQKLRQAILAATDMVPVMRAAVGPEQLWAANGALMPKGTQWYVEAGTENYCQKNVDKAKQLAKEAGYNGEPIRYMCTTQYPIHYDSSVVIAKQLKDAGFNIDLQVYDWATLVSRRVKPDVWDLYFTTHGFVPDPVLQNPLNPTYPGWWDTPAKGALLNEFTSTMDPQKRLEIYAKIQALFYEEVPMAKTGDIFTYNIYSPRLGGVGDTTMLNWPRMWNVWLK